MKKISSESKKKRIEKKTFRSIRSHLKEPKSPIGSKNLSLETKKQRRTSRAPSWRRTIRPHGGASAERARRRRTVEVGRLYGRREGGGDGTPRRPSGGHIKIGRWRVEPHTLGAEAARWQHGRATVHLPHGGGAL
jgi:hypothetical protein